MSFTSNMSSNSMPAILPKVKSSRNKVQGARAVLQTRMRTTQEAV